MTRRRKVLIGIAVALLVYVGSYAALSRRAYRVTDSYELGGYYFVFPHPEHPARIAAHWALVVVYYPLIQIEEFLGTGRSPSISEPLWSLWQPCLRPCRRAGFVVTGVLYA